MRLTRRTLMTLAGTAWAGLWGTAQARPIEPDAEEVIAEFVGDAPVQTGGITLQLPEVAEDGHRVRAEIDAPGAREVLLVAPANPVKAVVSVEFGAMAVTHRVVTRIRLAGPQEVVALARMPDGSVTKVTHRIDVLVGGCG